MSIEAAKERVRGRSFGRDSIQRTDCVTCLSAYTLNDTAGTYSHVRLTRAWHRSPCLASCPEHARSQTVYASAEALLCH
jgi:hypothetical protein